jgi:metal-sulfur cluster biosynthetic enzyme
VQPHKLDQRPDLWLGAAEANGAPVGAQPTGQHGQVQHQRGVGEDKPREVDDDIGLRADGPRKRPATDPLGAPVLVALAAESGRFVIEIDDCRNLPKSHFPRQGLAAAVSYTDDMVSADDVTEVLRDVIDPELGLDFVELGLIYDVEVEEGVVRVTYTLTSPGCPIGPQVSEQIEEFVSELDGVQEVHPTMTFSPPWTPDRMSEDAKFALGF